MKFVSATDIGLMREENQDIVRVEEYYGNVLAVVCDGMGGERSGQDASRIAINEVFSRFSSGFSPDLDTIAVRQLMTASRICFSPTMTCPNWWRTCRCSVKRLWRRPDMRKRAMCEATR